MSTIMLQEAQSNLLAVVNRLLPGEEVLITDGEKTVAKLTVPPRKPRQLGTMRGTVLSMEHFDDHLDDFEEYM